mmetsp:Transcript_31649/g.75494  ORF Transcript_31649/g.75494 Transcript_31649/m.75494 type:complete len:394 (-) Transcript_31649:133-1314(-)
MPSALRQLLEGAAGAGHTFRGPLVPRAALCQPEVPSRATSFEAKGAKEPGPAEEEIDPSKLESGLPDDDERTECNLDALKLGNQTGMWSKEKDDIKWAYDNTLKGQEVQIWWPGKTDHGECNDLHEEDRGCWYRGKLLNDPHCTDGQRCIHFASHDGEPSNTYTCPTWIRDPEGIGCKLPVFDWQACPMRFKMMRVDTGIPQEFKLALTTPCSSAAKKPAPAVPQHQFPERDPKTGEPMEKPGAAADEASGEAQKVKPKDDGGGKSEEKEPEMAEPPLGHCSGPTNDADEPRMIFDMRKNTWYRCSNMMRCEPWDIRKIDDSEMAQCGTKKCGPEQQCFVHRISALQSTHQCVKDDEIMMLADGDDVAKLGMPHFLALASFELPKRRREGPFL